MIIGSYNIMQTLLNLSLYNLIYHEIVVEIFTL